MDFAKIALQKLHYRKKADILRKNISQTRRLLGSYPEKIDITTYSRLIDIEKQQIADLQHFETMLIQKFRRAGGI